jgi:hypothetical protein
VASLLPPFHLRQVHRADVVVASRPVADAHPLRTAAVTPHLSLFTCHPHRTPWGIALIDVHHGENHLEDHGWYQAELRPVMLVLRRHRPLMHVVVVVVLQQCLACGGRVAKGPPLSMPYCRRKMGMAWSLRHPTSCAPPLRLTPSCQSRSRLIEKEALMGGRRYSRSGS